jgi:hypothetical protein
MLNARQFYAAFGVNPGPDQHLEIEGRQVICYENKFYIVCLNFEVDPFNWLADPIDAVVFKTVSGYLAIMVLFDGENDQTQEAVEVCARLAA